MSRRIMDIDNDKVGELFSKANDNFEEVYATDAKQDSEIKNKATQADFNKLKARVDNLTQTPAGSTEGNAELLDIRVGADGKTYPTAGEAVRAQAASLKEDIDNYNLIFERVNLFNKNKIKDNVINNQSIGSSYGSFITLDGYFASELIEISPNDKLFVWGAFDELATSYVTFYSSDKKVISIANGIGVHTIAPENAAYFSVSATKTKINTFMVYKEQPTTYYPYNYVRSNDDKIKENKVNLFNGEVVRGYYCDNNLANLKALENAVTSLPIVVHGKAKISYRNDGNEGFSLHFYDEDYNRISTVWCAKGTKNVIDIPTDAFYIKFQQENIPRMK